MSLEDLGRALLQPYVEGQGEIPLAVQDLLHLLVAGTVAVTHERDQLAVVELQHGMERPLRRVPHANQRGSVLVAL